MTNTETSQMPEVYAVIGGWEYEGEHFDSLKLFDCKSAAEAYAQKLEEGDYEYALIETRTINMESAICA
jgi:hypothetical protein